MPSGVYNHKPWTEEQRRKIVSTKKGKKPKNWDTIPKTGRFKKGGTPWNKGTKGLIKPNSGNFKKGDYGEKSPRWKGGITPLIHLTRELIEYKQWRSNVFERDNWVCQTCNKRGYVEAHHIIEFAKIFHKNNITKIEDAIECKELWDLNNGVTLCLDCHNLTKKRGYYGFTK